MQVIKTQSNTLETIRAEVVGDIMRGYGATKRYAEELTATFGTDWYLFEHNDKSDAAKPTLAEAQAFRDELRKAGHTNPSVVWTRVRNEGRKLVEGETKPEGQATESAGTKEVRGLTRRLVEELSILHSACKREAGKNNLDAKQTEAHTFICSALKALNVDLSLIK